MAATQTWGIDAQYISFKLRSQIRIAPDAIATTEGLDALITASSALVNVALKRAGIVAADVDPLVYVDEFIATRELVWALLHPEVQILLAGANATDTLVVTLRAYAQERLTEFRKDPSMLGYPGTGLGGEGGTSTQSLGLSSTTCPHNRRNDDYCNPPRW